MTDTDPAGTVLVESGPVTIVSINRPEVHNSVDSDTAHALEAAVRAFDADEAARVLILTGAGGRAFSSGAGLGSTSP